MDDLPLETFEPVAGVHPGTVLDRHPDGRSVALQLFLGPDERAGVWDADTGHLIWWPHATYALCWTADGRHIYVLRRDYDPEPGDPDLESAPLDSGDSYVLECRTWPERRVVGACEVAVPEGWVDRVVLAPRDDLAAIRWIEQDCAGFVLVALDGDRDHQLPDAGYRTAPNGINGPVFSPDGWFLALSCGKALWWWTDPDEDPETPAAEGRYELGHVAIYDVARGTVRDVSIEAHVPAGWLPADPADIDCELLGAPRFIAPTEFVVTLPTGEERQFRTE